MAVPLADLHAPHLLARLFPADLASGASFYHSPPPMPRVPPGQTLPNHFNLVFQPSPTPTLAQAAAVDHVGHQLATTGDEAAVYAAQRNPDEDEQALARRWLFPREADLRGGSVAVAGSVGDQDWVDRSLNEEQQVRAHLSHGIAEASDPGSNR